MLVQKLNDEELENLGLIRSEYSTYEGSYPWMIHLKDEQDKKRMICTRSSLSYHDFFNPQKDRLINTCLRSFVLKEHVDLKVNDIIQMYQFDKDKTVFNFKEIVYTDDKSLDNFFKEQFIIGEDQELKKTFKDKENFKSYFKQSIYHFVRMEKYKTDLKSILKKHSIEYVYNQEKFVENYNKFIDFIFSENDSLEFSSEQEVGDFVFCYIFFEAQGIFENKIKIDKDKIMIKSINKIREKIKS